MGYLIGLAADGRHRGPRSPAAPTRAPWARGRTGGTNALRAMGARAPWPWGLDVPKGVVPIALAWFVGASPLAVALTGVAAVLGAWKSVFLRFHGGRGVATGVGGMLVVQPLAVLLAAPFFFGIIY